MEQTHLTADTAEHQSNAIAKYDFNPDAVKEMTGKYLALHALDQKSYAAVYTAHQEIKKKRIGVTNRTQELMAPIKDELKKIKDTGAYIIGLLAPAEDHLDKTRTAFEKAKQARRDAQTQERINKLRDNGCTYDNGYYTVGVLAVEAKKLTHMGARKWNKLLKDVIAEHKQVLEAAARMKAIDDLRFERLRLLEAYGVDYTGGTEDLGLMTDAEFKALSAPYIRAYYEKQNQQTEEEEELPRTSAGEELDFYVGLAKAIEDTPAVDAPVLTVTGEFVKREKESAGAVALPVFTDTDVFVAIIDAECDKLGMDCHSLSPDMIQLLSNCMISYLNEKTKAKHQCVGCGEWKFDVATNGMCNPCDAVMKEEAA